ncbi:hypothetical protein NLG97_g5518 [Lecanicillium saksenae]|uniref:Uncharacterized protein n=1 Tax=Lecanicillium saksenae TaxID=468837 RepID=A0ACC1QS79_9HYPO|nr:hypothetical protein NLG97_g5518 [Lecanicillium saksenae]
MDPDAKLRNYDVIIIGAGVSGVNAGYRLLSQAPGTRFVILESRGSIGGTWDLFRYPGIRSDSDVFTFGFAWSPWHRQETLAQAADIKAYMVNAAKETGVDKHIIFHRKVLSANWTTSKQRWEVLVQEKDQQEPVVYRGRFIFLGTGYYNYEQPRKVLIPGIENFKGKVIHPQFWPENYDYTDKEMVVIGSGATAVTIVPAVAGNVKQVTMLQRSPGYMISIANRSKIRRCLSAILPSAIVHRINRTYWITFTYLLTILCAKWPTMVRDLIRRENIKLLPKGYSWDPHFKPRYMPWDERLCAVPDGDIFTAIRSSKAVVVTDTIDTITEDSVKLTSGKSLHADVIVTATGISLLFAGGIRFTTDDVPFDPSKKFVWNAAMIQDLPNVVFSLGYLKSGSWTLGADCAAQLLIRLMKQLQKRSATSITPYIDDATVMESRPLWGLLKSGYLKGYENQFPQTSTGIWCNRDNYIKDMYAARWGDIETGLRYH